MDPRRAGVDNDAAQISNLPNYPLERIDIPTLIVHGEADATVSYAHARAAADAIPGTHETLFADGRAVNAIAAFLAEHTATLPEPPSTNDPAVSNDGRRISGSLQRHIPQRSSSRLSPGSVLSWASALSIASAASVLSVGSFASILSIGSFGSVLSIGSSGKFLSIGRSGGLLHQLRSPMVFGRWLRRSPTPSVTTPTARTTAPR